MLPVEDNIFGVKVLNAIISKSISSQDQVLYASNYIDISALIKNIITLRYNHELNYFEDFGARYIRFKPIDVYILSLNSPLLIDQLNKFVEWNSRAKFIVYYNSNDIDRNNADVYELFKYFAENFIYNALVLTERGVYSNDPYKYENVNEPYISPYIITKNASFTNNKLPDKWRNTSLYALVSCIPPFSIDFDRKYLTGGTEYRLLNEIMLPSLKFNMNYINDFSNIGILLSNGTYSSLLGRLQRKEAAFAFGGISTREEHLFMDFDISYPFGEDVMTWAVPTPPILSHGANLIRICTPQMWIMLLLTMSIACISWFLIGELVLNEHYHYKDKWEMLMMPWKFLFSELSSFVPKSLQIKILFLSTWVFVFIINAAWEANLILTLTYNNRDKEIKSLKDVIDRNLIISITNKTAILYLHGGGQFGKEVYERNIVCDDFAQMHITLDRIAVQKDIVGIITRGVLKYLISMGFLLDHGIPAVRELDENFFTYSISQIFIRGHPVYPRYQEHLNWIRASGINNMYFDDVEHNNRIKQIRVPAPAEHNILTLEQMISAFVLLGIGYVMSSIAFIFEFLCFRL